MISRLVLELLRGVGAGAWLQGFEDESLERGAPPLQASSQRRWATVDDDGGPDERSPVRDDGCKAAVDRLLDLMS